MIFGRSWVLLLLLLPAAWVAWEWTRSSRRAGLAIKGAVFALILLALAEPGLELWERRQAIAVLSDASASVPAEQREQAREFVRGLRGAAGDAQVRPITFASGVRRGLPEAEGQGEPGGTNLELALSNALAALPPDRVPRIVLLSDGLENLGAVERAVHQARFRGAPVDVKPLAGRAEPALRLSGLDAPEQAYFGERFPIELAVESPAAVDASIQLSAEGKPLGATRVRLAAGENFLRVQARLEAEGATLIRGDIAVAGAGTASGELTFHRVVRIVRPRALLLSDQVGGDLEGVLRASGFDIERRGGVDGSLNLAGAYELVIADNQNFERWPAASKARIESYVSGGGGFLLVAGERNLYVEREADARDPLNRMLPATLAPPRTPETTAVVLVLDKSSSMEGKKMQLARQSAMGVVDNLRPVDRVGVLVFDNSFQWAIPIRDNDEAPLLKRLIAGIIADGGTQIAPALHEAYRQIRPQDAVYKHILLLTDGISEEGDSIQLAREAAQQKVTISTIGLGQDVNRAYLERVAENAKGRSHFLLDVSQLAQVVLRDVLEHTGSSVTEQEFAPRVVTRAELLDDVQLSEAGPLLGWVRFETKPSAETLLAVDNPEEDPLLVRWQYGLGRAAVFSSDARSRWAANWTAWQGFDRFWANVARDLLPRSPADAGEARYDRASGELAVVYRLSGDAPATAPDIYVLGPDGFRATAKLERTAEGVYEARTPIGGRFGLFRIRAAGDDGRFAELGFYRENEELSTYGSDPDLLARIAAATGGRVDPSPAETARSDGRATQSLMELWPLLLGLAVLLNLAEILARKGWLPWLGRWA